jgi:hypothetical protein
MPGQVGAVTGTVDFDTGADEMARALGGFGQAMQGTGAQIWKVQADKEFSEARLESTRQVNGLQAWIEGNHDIQGIVEKTTELKDSLQDREFNNGLAARKYQEWLNLAMPNIEAGIAAKVRKVTIDDWTAAGTKLMAEAEATGNMSAVTAYFRNGVRNNMVSKTQATNLIAMTRHNAETRAAASYTMRFPEQALEDIKADKFKNFPGLTPGEVQNFRAIAKGQIAHNKTRLDDAQEKEAKALWNLSLRPETTMADIVKNINSMQFSTVKEKDAYLKSTASRMDLIHKGVDPLRVTQDYPKFWELKQLAIDGKTTEKDWRDAVNKNQISIANYDEGVNIIEGKVNKEQVEDEVDAGKQLDRFINAIGIYGSQGTARETARMKGHLWLDGAIKGAKDRGTPLTATELTGKVLQIGRRLRWEIGNLDPTEIFPTTGFNLEEFERFTIPAPGPTNLSPAGPAFDFFGTRIQTTAEALSPGPSPVTITTPAEYEKLGFGEWYIDSEDGKWYQKQ